jgi:hypothetical protein
MTTKNNQQTPHPPAAARPIHLEKKPRPASLMAIQEKLGLFKLPCQTHDAKNCHDYLKNKPLGFI